ncbi:MAG TPA: tRNA 2-thiouridine(34) synthase MnmA [Candidatus Saccharimonadales bacterium]|jgi:tRNA-specific 2-thiouridylase
MNVFIGMSGGVDSSLSAALLVEQGHKVTGVYMKNWTQDLPGMRCPWADDLADAKRVAVQLGIPLKVYDFENDYKHHVVDYMVTEYEAGRTPNPDIMCNQEVKFRLFLDAAVADGAEMIATGHYAKVEVGRLLMAADTVKDQTYFLYRVTGEALKRTIFPLGDYTKVQVRELAEQRGLATAAKPDSQGICFVGSVGIREFLSQYVTTEPGDIIDRASGKMLGRHDGAIYYTLGQRHGLNVGGGLPYYVTGKDMDKNEVYVSRDLNDESLWRTDIQLADVHWIGQPPATTGVQVRLRHRGAMLSARLDGSTLHLENPERAVATGQSAVIYVGDECVGGGIVA